MARPGLDILLTAVGCALSFVALLIVLRPSLLVGLALGIPIGVLLAPSVRRASAWLERYLRE